MPSLGDMYNQLRSLFTRVAKLEQAVPAATAGTNTTTIVTGSYPSSPIFDSLGITSNGMVNMQWIPRSWVGATQTVATVARVANTVTVSTAPAAHGFLTGSTVTLAGVTSVGGTVFNGTFENILYATATSFTFTQVGANDTGTGGTATTSLISQGLWLMVNARYDTGDGYFYRIVDTDTAFGLEILGTGTVYGEEINGVDANNQCFTIWRAQPRPGTSKIGDGSPWVSFAVTYGWELGLLASAYRDLVMGGFGMEVDGAGTYPYGRFANTQSSFAISNISLVGMLTNLYMQMTGADDYNVTTGLQAAGWAVGVVNHTDATAPYTDRFAVMRMPPGTMKTVGKFTYADFAQLFSVYPDGFMVVPKVSGAPATAIVGGVYYDTAPNVLKVYDGAWHTVAASVAAGVTDSAAGVPTDIHTEDGVVTAITRTAPVVDGTYTVGGPVTPGGTNGQITVTNGIITAVTQAT